MLICHCENFKYWSGSRIPSSLVKQPYIRSQAEWTHPTFIPLSHKVPVSSVAWSISSLLPQQSCCQSLEWKLVLIPSLGEHPKFRCSSYQAVQNQGERTLLREYWVILAMSGNVRSLVHFSARCPCSVMSELVIASCCWSSMSCICWGDGSGGTDGNRESLTALGCWCIESVLAKVKMALGTRIKL